jgi:hypothetical protein
VFEVLIVAALVIGVVAVATVPWPSLLVAGVLTAGVGLVFGVATGFWYHVALGRALSAANALTPRWWVRPVPLHDRLDAADRRSVMPWFYAGAIGFFVTIAGIAVIALSMAVGFWRSS